MSGRRKARYHLNSPRAAHSKPDNGGSAETYAPASSRVSVPGLRGYLPSRVTRRFHLFAALFVTPKRSTPPHRSLYTYEALYHAAAILSRAFCRGFKTPPQARKTQRAAQVLKRRTDTFRAAPQAPKTQSLGMPKNVLCRRKCPS